MPAEEKLRETLARFVRGGRLSHAVLIEGPPGCGGKETALWLASMLLCREKDAPCGKCSVCRRIADGNHPDVEIVTGEGRGGEIKIDQIRGIREELWLSPNEADERIFILPDIDDMNVSAQNAFLKSLEEPPPFVRFIMTCRNSGALLDTIVSRVSVFTLDPPTPAECEKELRRRFPGADGDDAALAAVAFDGSVGAAADALSGEGGLTLSRLALETLLSIKGGREYAAMAGLAKNAAGRDEFLEFLARLRTLSMAAALPRREGPAQRVFHGAVTQKDAVRAVDAVPRAVTALESNCSPELTAVWLCGELSGGA